MNFRLGVLGLMAICAMASAGFGQRSFAVASPVIETFDSLGTANVTVVDNTTITGFYSRKSLTDTDGAGQNIIVASNGAGANALNNLFHFGATGNTERAFGGSPEGTAPNVGDLSWGLRLVNSGSLPITSISVGFTGEYWHYATNANQITFDYRVVNAATDIIDLTTGTYTPVAGLTYAPATGTDPGGQGAKDGNAVGNRQIFTPTSIILSTALQPGGEIMLRWTLPNISGINDKGLAIDDVTVAAIGVSSAPATISGRVVTPQGRAISKASILVTDQNGESLVVLTNSFGYFNAAGLASGQSYVVSVSARGYTFANSSYVVDLSDNIGDLNFVSTR